VEPFEHLELEELFLRNYDVYYKKFNVPNVSSINLSGYVPDFTNVTANLKQLNLDSLTSFFSGPVRVIQLGCPNLEHFSLVNSNVTNEEFQLLDWSLWPRLIGLNFEQNYTLTLLPGCPTTIQELRIAYTGIDFRFLDPLLLQNLRNLHCYVGLNAFQCFRMVPGLNDLKIVFKEFIHDEKMIWASLDVLHNLKRLTLKFKEYFNVHRLAKEARYYCQENLHVSLETTLIRRFNEIKD